MDPVSLQSVARVLRAVDLGVAVTSSAPGIHGPAARADIDQSHVSPSEERLEYSSPAVTV
eukprot:1053969-Pyramimonas_sp.AAC.1